MTSLSVKFVTWNLDLVRQVIASCGGLDTGFYIAPIRIARVGVSEGADADAILAAFRANPNVERAHFEGKVYNRANYYQVSDDTLLDTQWNLKRINAFHAWKYTTGDPAVKIFIVDTGVIEVEETTGRVDLANSWNTETGAPGFTDANTYFYDEINDVPYAFSHGTILTGIIKAVTGNAHGLAGIAPGCTLGMCVFHYDSNHITDADAAIDSLEAAAGVVKAADLGARVINCSWGWTQTYPASAEQDAYTPYYSASYKPNVLAAMDDIHDAFDYAWTQNAIVVGAAANMTLDAGSTTNLFNPVANTYTYVFPVTDYTIEWPNVVGVSRVDVNDRLAYDTEFGAPIDIVAPAHFIPVVGIQGDINGQPPLTEWIHNSTGNSYAAPQVCAVLGLVLSVNPNLTNQQAVDIVLQNGDTFRDTPYSGPIYGNTHTQQYFPNAKMLNAAKAVLKALTTVPANAGAIYPYFNVWGAGSTVTVAGASATNTLSGDVSIEISGFSTDLITSVELWVGSSLAYSGPPITMSGIATYSGFGTGQLLKVVAYTANDVIEETFTDIYVSSLVVITAETALNATTAFEPNAEIAAVAEALFTAATVFESSVEFVMSRRRNARVGSDWVYGEVPPEIAEACVTDAIITELTFSS